MPDRPRPLPILFRDVLKRLGFDGYEPARHYMRGPGPKSRARENADSTGSETPGQSPVDVDPRDKSS